MFKNLEFQCSTVLRCCCTMTDTKIIRNKIINNVLFINY